MKNTFSAIFLGVSLLLMHSMAGANEVARKLISEFNDSDTGAAFTMLSLEDWQNPGKQIFHDDPSTPLDTLQAVTISNASKSIYPYPADTRFGLLFSIAESSGFYRYFAMRVPLDDCAAGEGRMTSFVTKKPARDFNSPKIFNWAVACGLQQVPFCGRCTDGGPCAGPQFMQDGWPVLGDLVPYKQFQKAKKSIVANTGLKCDWNPKSNAWNEFDTSGLSRTALKAVLHDKLNSSISIQNPDDGTLCGYLNSVDSSRKTWPVLSLVRAQRPASGTRLVLEKILTCQKD